MNTKKLGVELIPTYQFHQKLCGDPECPSNKASSSLSLLGNSP
jgi:hypothetical protein